LHAGYDETQIAIKSLLGGCAMTTTKKIAIGPGLLVSLVGIVSLLTSCMTPTVSRVPIPGSSLSAVVTADLAGCYDVQLYENGQPIPNQLQCLGTYASMHCSFLGFYQLKYCHHFLDGRLLSLPHGSGC
jgi:hypothetical protein